MSTKLLVKQRPDGHLNSSACYLLRRLANSLHGFRHSLIIIKHPDSIDQPATLQQFLIYIYTSIVQTIFIFHELPLIPGSNV